MNKIVLGTTFAILAMAVAVSAESYTCVMQPDNVTMICNYTDTCNFNNTGLNTTLINEYFNVNCTNKTEALEIDLANCRNETTNLTAKLQILEDITNVTSDYLECQMNFYDCNKTLETCSGTAKNASDAYLSSQEEIGNIRAQCTAEKAALERDFDNVLQSYYLYIGIAFIAGYFVIREIRKRGTGTKQVDDRTKEDPSKRFQV